MDKELSIQISTYTGKSTKYLLIVVSVLVALNLAFVINQFVENDLRFSILINFIVSLLLVSSFWAQSKIERLNFIAFENDRFVIQKATAFKQSKDEILYTSIESISKKTYKIVVALKNNSFYEIDIQNYPYSAMTMIKNEFAKLSEELGNKG